MSVRKQKGKGRDGSVYDFWIVDIKYRHSDGRIERVRKVPRYQTRAAAERLEREILQMLTAGTYEKKTASHPSVREMPTLAQFAEEFMVKYVAAHNKPSEQSTKQRIIRQHLAPGLGRILLDQIGQRDISGYIAAKKKTKLSPKTINNHLMVLGRMLRVAAEWGIITDVPAIKKLKEAEPVFDFLTFEEARRLVASCTDDLRRQVVFILNTGLRIGEVRALRWEHVDMVRGQMIVRLNDWKGIEGPPKGGRTRVVPLNAAALAVLREHRHLRSKRVFCKPDGSRLGEHPFSKKLATACRRAELRWVSWHVMRHTFASHLAMCGVPLKAVQELMGHATIEMTMRYAHLSPDVRDQAVDALLQGQYRGNTLAGHKKDQQKQAL